MSARSLDQWLAAAVLASAANRGDTTGLRGSRQVSRPDKEVLEGETGQGRRAGQGGRRWGEAVLRAAGHLHAVHDPVMGEVEMRFQRDGRELERSDVLEGAAEHHARLLVDPRRG